MPKIPSRYWKSWKFYNIAPEFPGKSNESFKNPCVTILSASMRTANGNVLETMIYENFEYLTSSRFIIVFFYLIPNITNLKQNFANSKACYSFSVKQLELKIKEELQER